MKTTKTLSVARLLALLLLFCSVAFQGISQSCSSPPSCLYNPEFTTSTGGDINPGSPSITGWYRSHGEPQVILAGGHNSLNAIELTGQGGGGNGVFACYNFKKNRQYKLCFWAKHVSGSSTNGSLRISATSGLTEPGWPVGAGGYNIPGVSSQVINAWTGTSSSWVQVSVTFTPTVDYNQLWIYPYSITAPPAYKVQVSDIVLFEVPLGYGVSVPCESTINLNAYGGACGGRTDWYDMDSKFIGSGTVVINDALPSMSGRYTMVVVNGDCSYSVFVDVNVQECNCEDVVPGFEYDGQQQPVPFAETTTGPGTSVGWYWDFGDGSTSNEQNPTHQYDPDQHYDVCVTIIRKVGDQTCCTKYCENITVGMPLGGFVAPKGGFGTTLLDYPKNALQFTEQTATNSLIKEYYWDFGDGTSSGQKNPAHVYKESGTYQVCLRITENIYDEDGNLQDRIENQYCHSVEVKAGTPVDIKVGEISVIPNPASAEAVVKVESMPNAKVTLHNVAGEQVATGKQVEQGRYVLQMWQLPSGIYIVEVTSESGTRSLKLIKE